MNTKLQTVRVGLFFVFGLALLWIVFETLSGGTIFRDRGYPLVAIFDDVKELRVGDEVRIAGVRVGAVSAAGLRGAQAQLTLSMDPGAQIPEDSVATIAMAGLLGGNYLAIQPGQSQRALAPGGELATRATPDLNSIMAQLGSLGESLQGSLGQLGGALSGGAEGDGIFARLDRLIVENSEQIRATTSNLEAITSKIASGEGTLGKLINDESAYDELLATVTEIRGAAAQANTFMADAQGLMAQLRNGEGTLGALLNDGSIAQEIQRTAANLREITDKIAAGQGTLGRLLADDSLYLEARSTLQKADRMIDSLGDQGPITALGVAGNALF
jgi:phospholipid/cholesterol/gamma-HCH transport system substrate-binding protein